MTPEQILSLIKSQKESVAVLLCQPRDELSMRAHQALLSFEGRLTSRGFKVFSLDIGPKTSSVEEFACVRAPQLRLFLKGKLQQRLLGVFDESDLESVLKSLG